VPHSYKLDQTLVEWRPRSNWYCHLANFFKT